ncbi:MAG: hypothetical protein K9G62_07660 [Alphaproteobacteria bacterium]|nr:hypothetical protein [Alphaproteobacteria bacterium]
MTKTLLFNGISTIKDTPDLTALDAPPSEPMAFANFTAIEEKQSLTIWLPRLLEKSPQFNVEAIKSGKPWTVLTDPQGRPFKNTHGREAGKNPLDFLLDGTTRERVKDPSAYTFKEGELERATEKAKTFLADQTHSL